MPEAILRSIRLVCLSAIVIFLLQFIVQLMALWTYLGAQKMMRRGLEPKFEAPVFRAEPELRKEFYRL
jgi:hypothetical protein